MFENELLQAILSSYGEDIINEKGKEYKELFYKIFPNANSETFDDFKKDLEKVLAKEKEKGSMDAIKKEQEAAKKYKEMKDKENPVVYVPIVCELSLSISGMIDDDLESSTSILGVFTDPEMAERQCETDINNDDDDWKELRSLHPYIEDKAHKVYKSKYFFNREFMVLEVKYRIILKVRLNDFDTDLILSSSELMDQNTYNMLLNIFENFKADYDILLVDVESNIDNLLEKLYMCKCCENKEEE